MPDERNEKVDKSYRLQILTKILNMPKKITFKLFSKFVHQVFLKLYLMRGIKKWVNVTDFDM